MRLGAQNITGIINWLTEKKHYTLNMRQEDEELCLESVWVTEEFDWGKKNLLKSDVAYTLNQTSIRVTC